MNSAAQSARAQAKSLTRAALSSDRNLEPDRLVRAAAGVERVRRARWILAGSVVATLLLYAFGGVLAYPLVYLLTLVHELGHGMTALLVGGRFDTFHMWSDASGLAQAYGHTGWQQALICAGGLVGPALGAAAGLALSRRPRWARAGLAAIGLFLVWAMLFKIRGGFGLGVAVVMVALTLGVAFKGKAGWAQLVLAFLSVQLALSVFSRGDYLFEKSAHVGGVDRLSDAAIMGQMLGGPYWLWGGLVGLVSVAALAVGGWLMLRRGRLRA